MSDLDYNSIKRKIESQKCSEHNKNPQFMKTSKGFDIKTCCENFRSELVKISERLIVEETQKAIDQVMRNAFKK
ncbi:hypothetical protein OF897_04370 [Chryseobacterium formosus]|uniref:Uncharacterized protein n=1 Tax=Chryseobacterium formosus TaxID=1537363 RepID=A0ABT3XNC9_9FLAO|nr:hypothetical protein [Chryseobacterium formosus]MCX8523156.1 hypothetical protein [Chryseobacterium formosus]